MGARCVITGKKTSFGNSVSHSHRKTRRRWKVNLKKKRVFDEETKRWFVVRTSVRGMRIIQKLGYAQAMRNASLLQD